MSNAPIRLGIIGMGPANMASTMTMLENEPDLRYSITAACARRPEILEQAAREFNIPFHSTDYRDITSRDDVDVVCVYSPDALHAESCIDALENGKHVVCTKPMVTELEDAITLVKLVRNTGLKFLVGQTMRFDRQFLDAKRRYDSGQLGKLIAVESFYLHDMRPVYDFTPWRLQMPQDFMFGGCVHSIDIIRAFGGDIKRVHAVANKGGLAAGYPIQDNFFINAEFTSGAIGRVSGLYGIVHPPLPMMQYGVYGTEGSLQGEYTDNEPGEIRVVLDSNTEEVDTTPFDAETDLSAYGHGATVIRYMRHFQDCIDNDTEPSPGVLDGAKSVAAGAAAWESIRTGNAVDVFNDF